MDRDNIFLICVFVAFFAVMAWKLQASYTVPVIVPDDEKKPDDPPVLNVTGSRFVPYMAAAAPYVFLPPTMPYLENRGGT